MTLRDRLLLFIILTFVLAVILIFFSVSKQDFTINDPATLVIITILIMLSFSTLLFEHFFTSPTDVISNSLSITIMLVPLLPMLSKGIETYYYAFLALCLLVGVSAFISSYLHSPDESPDSKKNIWSQKLKSFSTQFGNSKVLYFIGFLLIGVSYLSKYPSAFLFLLIYIGLVLAINPQKVSLKFLGHDKQDGFALGKISAVISKNLFRIKLFKDKSETIRRFNFVEFKYSVYPNLLSFKGIILDTFWLDDEQWIDVLSSEEINNRLGRTPVSQLEKTDVIYDLPCPVNENNEKDEIYVKLQKTLVGTIAERSDIGKIRFRYTSKIEIEEGTLLECTIREQKVLYQVINGLTNIENLDEKNKAGLVIGEAIQVGTWNTEKHSFEKFGWIPEMCTPLFLADNVEGKILLVDDEFEIGKIPNTNYPVIVNKKDLISHHTAILGVTGSGKSVLTRKLIDEVISRDSNVKIICVDFTGEYKEKFENKFVPIIDKNKENILIGTIESLSKELAEFKNKQDDKKIENNRTNIRTIFAQELKTYLESEETKIGIFELPEIINTETLLEYTKWFFQQLFDAARKESCYGKRVCIVLEEAHTVVPETTTIGSAGKNSQSLVTSIGQIALQGRKYDIGFIVIAQRTANVSKTILTQCNTLITFQAFDDTSIKFLSNHLGEDFINTVGNLKRRHAIIVGKALGTTIPLIFEVPELNT